MVPPDSPDVYRAALRTRPIPGETACGDAGLCIVDEQGALVALVDGLGHGPSAADAARRALAIVQRFQRLPLTSILGEAHLGMRGTRGAVIALARANRTSRSLEVSTLGNVSAVVLRPHGERESLVSRPGVLGSSFRDPLVSTVHFDGQATLCLTTDGVEPHFDMYGVLERDPDFLAAHVVKSFGKNNDDAGCLVLKPPVSLGATLPKTTLRRLDPLRASQRLQAPLPVGPPPRTITRPLTPAVGRGPLPLKVFTVRGSADAPMLSFDLSALAKELGASTRASVALSLMAGEIARRARVPLDLRVLYEAGQARLRLQIPGGGAVEGLAAALARHAERLDGPEDQQLDFVISLHAT